MRRCIFLFWLLVLFHFTLSMSPSLAQSVSDARLVSPARGPKLDQAVLCEDLTGCVPKNEAVVFSVAHAKVVCLTEFDPVLEHTTVQHKWFRKDTLVTSVKLALEPPRWSTFSRIELRSADKGPWRVEVVDEVGKLLATLRFSVTD